jgi:hypothetical protein
VWTKTKNFGLVTHTRFSFSLSSLLSSTFSLSSLFVCDQTKILGLGPHKIFSLCTTSNKKNYNVVHQFFFTMYVPVKKFLERCYVHINKMPLVTVHLFYFEGLNVLVTYTYQIQLS